MKYNQKEIEEIIIETESTSETRDWEKGTNLTKEQMKKERNRNLKRIREVAKAIVNRLKED